MTDVDKDVLNSSIFSAKGGKNGNSGVFLFPHKEKIRTTLLDDS